MKRQEVKTFAWGAVAGAIVVSIGLFATGWAVTKSSAEQAARMASETAVTDSLAKICVAQYEVAPNKSEKLAALKEANTWQRGSYVVEQGWATMPGSESGTSQVGSACATLLVALQG